MDKISKYMGKAGNLMCALETAALNAGIIDYRCSIEQVWSSHFLNKLMYLVARKISPVKIYITSPGGEVYIANAIYDALISAGTKGITTVGIVEGYAASAASMIMLQGCSTRLAAPSARLHMHEPSQWIVFEHLKASTMEDEVKEMQELTRRIAHNIAKRAHKTDEEIMEFFKRRERWMSAGEAMDFGFIDGLYL